MLYRAFDLIIDSPFPLPEALPINSDCSADITVVFESVDLSLFFPDTAQIPSPGSWWYTAVSKQHMAFGCLAGIYEIRDGSRIAIDPLSDVPEEQIRIFLLGSALGALQIQRGRTPLHGGAIVSNGKAVIITGQQGAGKSTMTSALVHNGFSYLTDDVSSVILRDGVPYVLPAYPQRKLVRDACISLGYDPDALVTADKGRDKLAVRDSENWAGQATPLHMLVELIAVGGTESLYAEPVAGQERLNMIMRSIYRFYMHLDGGNLPPGEFKKFLTIASNIETYRVYVPHIIKGIKLNAVELAKALDLHN